MLTFTRALEAFREPRGREADALQEASFDLADIDRREITRIICLGDLVGKGPDSARAVDICVARCEAVVKGNWDESMATADDAGPHLRWQRERLGPARLEYLASLPISVAASGSIWL